MLSRSTGIRIAWPLSTILYSLNAKNGAGIRNALETLKKIGVTGLHQFENISVTNQKISRKDISLAFLFPGGHINVIILKSTDLQFSGMADDMSSFVSGNDTRFD